MDRKLPEVVLSGIDRGPSSAVGDRAPAVKKCRSRLGPAIAQPHRRTEPPPTCNVPLSKAAPSAYFFQSSAGRPTGFMGWQARREVLKSGNASFGFRLLWYDPKESLS